MENDEEKIEESFTPVDIILAFIIPFILFWGGMLAPVFTDSIYLWCLSLIPFYAYLFFGFMFSGIPLHCCFQHFKRKKERSLGKQCFVEFFDIDFIDGANIYCAPKLGNRLEHM